MADGGNFEPEDGVPRSGGAAPGWYYADGDPVGTVRQWDGAQWVGGPTAPESVVGGQIFGGEKHTSQPVEAWLLGWKKWNVFSGRARRAEYWWFALFNLFIQIALQVIGAATGLGFLEIVFVIVSLVPGIAVGVRRMHDTNRSGWWLLLPIVNLIFSLLDSHEGPNKYGPSPKY